MKPADLFIMSCMAAFLLACEAADINVSPIPTDDLAHAQYFHPVMAQGYDIERTVFGIVEARNAYEIKAETNGQVTSVSVEDGDVIAAGTRLATIDIDSALLLQDGLRERLAAAEIELATQETELERSRQLLEKGFVSRSDFEASSTLAAVTRSRVKDLRKSLASSSYDNTRATLTAPVGGLVSRRYISKGDLLSPGSLAFQILPQEDFDARFSIPIYMKDSFSVGDKVTLVLEGISLNGTVRSIIPDIDETFQTFTIVIAVPPSPLPLLQGQGISLNMTRRVEREGFWVHRSSLVSGLDGAMAVQIATNPEDETYSARRISVKVHHLADEKAFVSGAVTSEDILLSVGSHLIYPGQHFRLGEETFGP